MGAERTRRTLRVPSELDGARLDRALAELAGQTRSWARERIRAGAVDVGGRAVRKPSTSVARGQELRVAEPAPEPATELEPAGSSSTPELTVVFEDDALAVIDKPAGMLTHAAGARGADSVAARAVRRFGPLPAIHGDDRPGIVHRLDAGTSGLLIVGKSERALEHLTGQFKARRVEKTYLALCLGQPRFDSHWIETPIARDPKHPERMTVADEGRASETYYEVRERFERASFVRVRPRTGRTHQVRVHLASIGHPLVGDRTYRHGVPRVGTGTHRGGLRDLPDTAPKLERHALHAAELAFEHPTSGESLTFRSELPADLAALLHWLRANDAAC